MILKFYIKVPVIVEKSVIGECSSSGTLFIRIQKFGHHFVEPVYSEFIAGI